MSLESYVVSIMEGKRPGKTLLYLLSLVYRQAVTLRHAAYDKQWIKTTKAPVPVISVGNIVAGGTGKTPLIRLLAEELSKEKKVAVLSRGYRSSAEHGEPTRVTSALCGDEPYWLASKLPQIDVWVGKNRTLSSMRACEHGAQVILLDDGMQHRRLHRDVQIVCMDAQDLFGKGYFLPRGMLRDLPERLKTADLIVINHLENLIDYDKIVSQLKVYTTAPVVAMRLRLKADLQGKKVGVFCGIAKPEKFLANVRDLGADIIDDLISADHRLPPLEQLEAFANRCRDQKADLLICTEKDQVKLPASFTCSLPIIALEAELEVIRGRSHWLNCLKRSYERRN